MKPSEELRFIKRCNRITNKIRKSYPTLKYAGITFEIKKLKIGSMFARWTSKNAYKVQIDYSKYRLATNEEIAGALAHEFIHFEEYSTWTLAKRRRWLAKYLKSPLLRAKTERRVDKKTIERGFGKALAANRSMRASDMTKEEILKAKRFYMFRDEIAKYAKRIGK